MQDVALKFFNESLEFSSSCVFGRYTGESKVVGPLPRKRDDEPVVTVLRSISILLSVQPIFGSKRGSTAQTILSANVLKRCIFIFRRK